MQRPISVFFIFFLTAILWMSAAPAHATLPQECLYHARQELPKDDPNLVGIRFNPLDTAVVQDDPLEEKAEGAYVGRQPVSTILSGTGSLQYKDGSEVPVIYVCLLNNDKALFVHTIPIAKTVFHSAAPQGKSAYSVLYMCDSKQTVSVRYPGSDETPPAIKIMFWNRVETMLPAIVDTGARYVNSYRQWWVKGKVGTLSAIRTNKPVLQNCHAM